MGFGASHTWDLGDMGGGLGINKTSSGSGRVPSCPEEGAGLSQGSVPLQEMRQLHRELQVKRERDSKPHGRKGWGGGRQGPGGAWEEAAGGPNTLGGATNLGSSWLELP